MHKAIRRRTCLILLPGAAAAAALSDRATAKPQPQPAASSESSDAARMAFPAQDPARVREMVGASHGKIDRVRELLKESPQLSNAAFDWGFGDWETALGAASHTGQREIAHLLMEHGARPDVFAFAMLGAIDVVKAMVVSRPGIQRARGPHGLTLLHHARAGGEAAKAVAEYLGGLGDADIASPTVELDPATEAAYMGVYAFGPGADERLEVTRREGQKQLSIQRIGRSARGLFHLGNHAFHPVGAPDVRVTFVVENRRAVKLAVTGQVPTIEASRV